MKKSRRQLVKDLEVPWVGNSQWREKATGDGDPKRDPRYGQANDMRGMMQYQFADVMLRHESLVGMSPSELYCTILHTKVG